MITILKRQYLFSYIHTVLNNCVASEFLREIIQSWWFAITESLKLLHRICATHQPVKATFLFPVKSDLGTEFRNKNTLKKGGSQFTRKTLSSEYW